MEQTKTIQIRKLKRIIGVRASTFRNFLNQFQLYDFPYGEFNADYTIPNEIGKFLVLNQHIIKQFELDYYQDKTPKEISIKIHREESEILKYLMDNNPEYFENGIYRESEKRPLRYISSYLIDKRLGRNFSFLQLLQNVAKNCQMDLNQLYKNSSK